MVEKPTMNDVARAAGVSLGTVSKVLNGNPTVAAELRERVLNAGAIGYLSKPFNEDRLIECLDKALNSHDGRNGGQ